MSLALRDLTILVVDGDADYRKHLQSLLEKSGASVMVARSVEDAIELQRRSPPRVVIADMQLGSGANDLIRATRKCDFAYRVFTPVIAITGFASHADKQRAMIAGFNAYIPKSMEPSCIVDAIARVLRDSTNIAA